jgi:hypothetical protein
LEEVVEGEVPLLLPIKMLRQLKVVIDLNPEHVCLAVLQKTIPLCFLPSGHVAIDVSDFGGHGFQFRHGLQTPEFSESDFRNPVEQASTGCVMLLHSKDLPNSIKSHGVQRSVCQLSQSLGPRKWCRGSHGRPLTESSRW